MTEAQRSAAKKIRQAIGSVLRTARGQANLTQRATAEAIGEKMKTYIAWESGERSPRIEDLPKLAEAFRLSDTTLARRIFDAIRG